VNHVVVAYVNVSETVGNGHCSFGIWIYHAMQT